MHLSSMHPLQLLLAENNMETGGSVQSAVILAGLVLGNIAALIGSYISLRVSLAELRVKVDRLEKDNDNLGQILSTQRSKGF